MNDEVKSMCKLPKDLEVGALAETRGNLWHLPDIWDRVWQREGDRNVTVAVLDTGFTPHPDLPIPKKKRSFIRGEQVLDGNGHGTHCAGTAVGRNGLGVAPNANLIVGKILSDRGSGGSDGIAQGVRWAVDEGADIISMSVGGGGYFQPMVDALQYAAAHGVIVNAAAGNSGFNGSTNTIDFPGKYLETLCNAAYRIDGQIAGFSSGGTQVDWACPGQDIISARHTGSGYVSMSGTSMATPFGSGLLAQIVGLQRREGHAEFRGIEALRRFLQQWCEDKGKAGKDHSFGFGVPKSDAIVATLAAEDVTSMGVTKRREN